jgi:hypothetical protein
MSSLADHHIRCLRHALSKADQRRQEWVTVPAASLAEALNEIVRLRDCLYNRKVKYISISFAPIVQGKGGNKTMSSVQLPVGGLLLTLAFADANGNPISAAQAQAEGVAVAWVSSNPAFATVAPTADGNIATAIAMPVDPTAVNPGVSVVSATVLNTDGKQAVGTITLADTDDVSSVSISSGPAPAPAAASPAASGSGTASAPSGS